MRSPSEDADSVGVIITARPATRARGPFLAGFVAGEGCFTGSQDGKRFTFEVGLGTLDRSMCEALHDWFGVGHIYDSSRREQHHDDQSAFMIQSLGELVDVVVPFMDEHLPPSYKREQYLAWRERLLDYWEHRAKRVRACTIAGCEEPRRAHGLCRHHLFKERGV